MSLLRLLFLFCLLGMNALRSAGAGEVPGKPPGEVLEFPVLHVFTLYLPGKAPADVLATMAATAKEMQWDLRVVAKPEKDLPLPAVSARAVTDLDAAGIRPRQSELKYFASGLSPAEKRSLLNSKQAVNGVFVTGADHPMEVQERACEMLLKLAESLRAVIYDDTARYYYTAASWKAERVSTWADEVPMMEKHIAVHQYQEGELLRAVTLGMEKFGLPDVCAEDIPRSQIRPMGILVNLVAQYLAEGGDISKDGRLELVVDKLHHKAARERVGSVEPNAELKIKLRLSAVPSKDGDADNRLWQIDFPDYPGEGPQERMSAALTKLLGSTDGLSRIRHNEKLEAASAAAKKKLPELRRKFNAGLKPGENLLLKVPFKTPAGGNEWMWVEIAAWKEGGSIEAILQNEPFDIPGLKSGSRVKVREEDVFDYILHLPDGTTEGNETAKIIQSMEDRKTGKK